LGSSIHFLQEPVGPYFKIVAIHVCARGHFYHRRRYFFLKLLADLPPGLVSVGEDEGPAVVLKDPGVMRSPGGSSWEAHRRKAALSENERIEFTFGDTYVILLMEKSLNVK